MMEDTPVITEERPKKKKSAPKIPTDEAEPSVKSTEKKRRAPKIPSIEQELPEEEIQQEEVVKIKKKRTPKTEVNDELIPIDEPIKKKKSKAPKPPVVEDDFQINESANIEELEAPVEKKIKEKKSKKPKKSIASLEDIRIDSLDEQYPRDSIVSLDAKILDALQPSEIDSSEYQRTLVEAFNNLASKVNFAEYVGEDQWTIIHPPKAARTEPKSRIRKMLPGGNKEVKPGSKPSVPKGSLFTRLRSSVNMLVRDENNLLFGEQRNYDMADYMDEEDGVDTDNLHRYAQQLRELEDQDREVNPEFLVLRDGKTVYGVHESDADGKVKLATRKPIYDRHADQKVDEQGEKKKLLSRLRIPFTRNKDQEAKSANSTPPDSRQHRKSSRKSLNDDLATMINDNPLMI